MSKKAVNPFVTGFMGRCPECGRGKLFKGFLHLANGCDHCGLDYDFADSGDGPAIFIMLIVGFIVVAAAIYTEIVYRPAYWVHGVLWVPSILLLSAGLMRPLKGLLIALQHKHKAGEGRME